MEDLDIIFYVYDDLTSGDYSSGSVTRVLVINDYYWTNETKVMAIQRCFRYFVF